MGRGAALGVDLECRAEVLGTSESIEEGGTYAHPTKDPSTRQRLVKMGNFFKEIRQKSVSEPAGIRQETPNQENSAPMSAIAVRWRNVPNGIAVRKTGQSRLSVWPENF